MIMLDLLKTQETGKHIRKSKMKLLNKLMMLTVITCLMLHILASNCNGFGPILVRILSTTFQT